MIDLFKQADPAIGVEANKSHLRAKVDERIGLFAPLAPIEPRRRGPWFSAAVSFAIVIVFAAVLVVLRQETPWVYAPRLEGLGDLPGVEEVVPLASGGVQTMAVDSNTIWVMTALAHKLQQISVLSGEIEATYTIDAYVEGVVVGGGYVWLRSYDNGGEVLRFDPADGTVDLMVPIGGPGSGAAWFDDSLWVSNDQGELYQISAAGEIVSTSAGELKGEGFGYLWVNDPATGLISSLSEDGTRGQIVIPTREGLETMSGHGVREVIEGGGLLWLMDGDYPWGTNLSIYDPNTGVLSSFGGLTFGLSDITEFDGSVWVTSQTDHLLIRVDPVTGDVHRYPMPGKAGGLVVADGSLWVTLYHPGAVVRLDPNAGLIEAADVVADDWNRFPHRLLCTGSDEAGGPTVILEPSDWIDYGSWSVIQAQLSNEGYVVCANGYVQGEATAEQRAADLDEALTAEGVPGPYVLVAAGDGVHSTRLFAEGRDDIVGVVLVDPTPVGFQTFYDNLLPEFGHPPWLDLDPAVSDSLNGFGDTPFVVIGQDPHAVFLNRRFIDTAGRDVAQAVNGFWQDGLDFYAGLSSDSRSITASGTGLDMLIWDRPELVVGEVLNLLSRTGTE